VLRDWRSNKGLIASASAHALLLGATLVAFSSPAHYDDAQESIPVEMVTDQAFSQIMKGEKTAKAVQKSPKVDKVADLQQSKPDTPTPDAKKDVPTPPPPLKRLADPGEDLTPDKQPEPAKAAALPPPRPTPDPPKVEPTPPERPQPAKAAPREEPKDLAAEPKPLPVERPKEAAKEPPKPEAPKPPPKPQLKTDDVAKLLERTKANELAKADKPTSKPKSGEEDQPQQKALNLSAISQFLDHDKPQRMASTGAQLQHTASLGAPNASAAKMSVTMWDSLRGIIADQYQRCWSQSGHSQEKGYFPVVRVQLREDGGLATSPVLTNPSADPDDRALAEAAIRAVRSCDPLRIPAQFAPFYSEWKSLPVRMKTEM
jgi:colicin import membrane protein